MKGGRYVYVDDDGYQRGSTALETGAKGALLGLGIGALTGNAGRGAAIGALTGYGGRSLGLFGGRKSRKVKKSRKMKSRRRSPKRKSLRR